MYTKTAFMSAWPVLGATIVASTFFAGSVAAENREFTVAYKVSTQGLNLSKSAGAHAFYARLKHAAQVVCTHGMRVDLAPSPNPQGCYEKALADAVHSVDLPLLTRLYLATHTLQEAEGHGIYAPLELAAE